MTREHDIVTAARILNSQRIVSLELLSGESKWLRSSVAGLYANMADEAMLPHADAQEVAQHATRLGMYLEQLKERNMSMMRLRDLATALGLEWPSEIAVTALFTESRGRRT